MGIIFSKNNCKDCGCPSEYYKNKTSGPTNSCRVTKYISHNGKIFRDNNHRWEGNSCC